MTTALPIFAACAFAGLMLGLRFKVPMLILASALVAALGVVTGLGIWPTGFAVMAMQGGYMAGLFVLYRCI